jgi:uncharacterized membrane protein YheB (UPF0754 family)
MTIKTIKKACHQRDFVGLEDLAADGSILPMDAGSEDFFSTMMLPTAWFYWKWSHKTANSAATTAFTTSSSSSSTTLITQQQYARAMRKQRESYGDTWQPTNDRLERPTKRTSTGPFHFNLLLELLLLLVLLLDSSLAFSQQSFTRSPLFCPATKKREWPSHPSWRQVASSRRTTMIQFPLTTTSGPMQEVNDDDDDNNNNNNKNDIEPTISGNIFQRAQQKFQARPGTYLLIPVIAALVGWFTNYLAVQMIFYPIHFVGIPLWRRPEVPLGLIGWQGIVPCKTKSMSEALVNMVTTELLTVPEAFARLDPRRLAKFLAPQTPQLGNQVISSVLSSEQGRQTMGSFPCKVWSSVTQHRWNAMFQFFNVRILTSVMKDLIRNCQHIFSLEDCVVNQMVRDRAKLGELFRKVGQKELDFLTNSGLWFGFLLGLIQLAVALVWDNPWALSIGGMIVGLATNWLALKWIFEPVNPMQLGPFVIQGMFLRRQQEVAAEFSKFFAHKIVNSQQIWTSILTDPVTTPALTVILAKHVRRLLRIISFGLLHGQPSESTIQKVTLQTIKYLPSYLSSGLHRYVDATIGLEHTLLIKMKALSPAKFERVLHPIFEEDELTLILAGGVLGFAAGLIQQGLETGTIKLSNPLPQLKKLWKRAHRMVQSLVQKLRSQDEPS